MRCTWAQPSMRSKMIRFVSFAAEMRRSKSWGRGRALRHFSDGFLLSWRASSVVPGNASTQPSSRREVAVSAVFASSVFLAIPTPPPPLPLVILQDLGWNDHFARAFAPYEPQELLPARVTVSWGSSVTCWTPAGEMQAKVAGRLRLDEEAATTGLPTVGDWVALRPPASTGAAALVHAILPRRTAFIRKMAGGRHKEQVVAANVDYVLVMTSLNREFNVRRLERYLTLARESGAAPVVVLSKIDLAPHRLEEYRAAAAAVAPGIPLHAISASMGEGVEALEVYSGAGKTIALLGSSGVGKSTLINRLAGKETLTTQPVRSDDRGRHTTTHRELVILPNGGVVIDTPGMRELQLWESAEGLTEAFSEIEELAAQCRFGNCRHQTEPGCAVLQAVEDGKVDAARLDSYLGLRDEVEAAEQRTTEQGRRAKRANERAGSRAMKPFKKR